jgi:hypothetical protein
LGEAEAISAGVLLLLAFSSLGAATCVWFFNDKLEKMLNLERFPPLRWLAEGLVVVGALLALAALVVAMA